jgi:hypothetical protein
MTHCNELCLKYKKTFRFDTPASRYCQNCNIFLEFDGFICPCCKKKLRNKPRTARRQRTYFENHPDKIPPRIG